MKRIAIIAGALAVVFASPVLAASLAFDDASDPVYDDGWDDGDDGGFGWASGWLGVGVVGSVATSTANGDGDDDLDGDIDTGGRAWALTLSTEAVPANPTRRLDGPLDVGQTITLEMDHDPVPGQGRIGVRLLSSQNEQRFALLWFGDRQSYGAIFDGFTTLNVPYTDEGLIITFQLTGTDSFSVDLTAIGGTTATLSGQLASGADISTLILNASSSGATETFFFNSIAVPEPGAVASAGAALAALLLVVRGHQPLQRIAGIRRAAVRGIGQD